MRFCLAFLLITLLLVAALPLQAQDADDTVLRIAMNNPTRLDPVNLSRFDLDGRDLVENLFIGLTRFNARAGQIEPALAESWTVSEDNITWTFTLRDDVQWVQYDPENGEVKAIRPVVAQDVVFAIQRGCDPDRPSPVTDNLFIITGCRAFATANTMESLDADRTIGVQAIDDTTLSISLLFPASYFLTMTSLPEFRPLPAELVDDSTGSYLTSGNIVTSGAWVVAEWLPNTSMRLVRNPIWSGDEAGNLSEIDVRFDVPIDGLAAEINSGALDMARLNPAVVSQISSADMLNSSDGNTLVFLGFSYNSINVEGQPVPSPLDFPAVRRALALALDRDALAATVAGSRGADHFTPLSAIAAPSSPGAVFDAATAQQTLATAGYPACTGFPQLTFAIHNDPELTALAQAIITQWQTNLGCPPDRFALVTASRQDILDSAHNTLDITQATRFPIWMLTWTADYPDAQGWIADALHCTYGYLRVGRGCEQVDAVMDQVGFSLDLRSRFTAYNQVETDLFGALGSFPVIPLVIEQHWWAQQPTLEGVASYGVFQFDRWILNRE